MTIRLVGMPVPRRPAATRMAVRICGRRTTGAPTNLLHFNSSAGFAGEPVKALAGCKPGTKCPDRRLHQTIPSLTRLVLTAIGYMI